MSVFSKMGETVSQATEAYKDGVARAKASAEKQFGLIIWSYDGQVVRKEINMKMYLVMYNPKRSLSERIMATMIYLENNMDFMNPRGDNHIAQALVHLNDLKAFWLKALDRIARLEKLIDDVSGKNLRAESMLKSVMAQALWRFSEFITDVTAIVDVAGHSESDHIPQTLFVGNTPQAMLTPGANAGVGVTPTNTYSPGMTKPDATPLNSQKK